MLDATHNSFVLDYLKTFCLGRSRAVKADNLSAICHTSRRDINEVIRGLRKSGHLVGSSKIPPYGYYIPITESEVKECLECFRSEILDMLQTYGRLRRAQRDIIGNVNSFQLFPAAFNDAGQMEMLLSEVTK